MYIAILNFDGKNIKRLELVEEKNEETGAAQYVGRSWVYYSETADPVPRVYVGTDEKLLAEIELSPVNDKGYKGTEAGKGFYTWAYVTRGAGDSWGITAGFIDKAGIEQEKVEVPETWKQGELFPDVKAEKAKGTQETRRAEKVQSGVMRPGNMARAGAELLGELQADPNGHKAF